jgi:hypothetical protein
MPGNRKRSDQGRGQSGLREAGLRGGVVLVDEPTEHVVASNVAERLRGAEVIALTGAGTWSRRPR